MEPPSPAPRAPLPNSYWFEEGLLLAGEYPGAAREAEARPKLRKLLDAGVRVFVDLTEEGELSPYAPLLLEEARDRGIEVDVHRISIPDVDIPRSARDMTRILEVLEEAREAGRRAMIHCWGGTGRTGTVVGCWLVSRGVEPEEALRRVVDLAGTMPKMQADPDRRTPDTDRQCEWVRGWAERAPT